MRETHYSLVLQFICTFNAAKMNDIRNVAIATIQKVGAWLASHIHFIVCEVPFCARYKHLHTQPRGGA